MILEVIKCYKCTCQWRAIGRLPTKRSSPPPRSTPRAAKRRVCGVPTGRAGRLWAQAPGEKQNSGFVELFINAPLMVFWKHVLHAADKKLWEQRFEAARETRRLPHVPGLSLRNERKTVAKFRLRRYIEVAQQAHPSNGEAPCWTSVTEELSHGSHFGRALVDVAIRCYKCQCCCVNCKSHLKSHMSHGQQIDSHLATSSEKLWGAARKLLLMWVCLKIVYPYTQWLMIIIPTKWLFHWGYTPFSDIPMWTGKTGKTGKTGLLCSSPIWWDSGLRCAVLTKMGIVFWPRQSRFLLELLKAIQCVQWRRV